MRESLGLFVRGEQAPRADDRRARPRQRAIGLAVLPGDRATRREPARSSKVSGTSTRSAAGIRRRSISSVRRWRRSPRGRRTRRRSRCATSPAPRRPGSTRSSASRRPGRPSPASPPSALHDSPDLDGYITAAQCWAISLAYLGRMEEMAACTEAAIAVADAAHHVFWSAAMRNWRSFGAVLSGDIATARAAPPRGVRRVRTARRALLHVLDPVAHGDDRDPAGPAAGRHRPAHASGERLPRDRLHAGNDGGPRGPRGGQRSPPAGSRRPSRPSSRAWRRPTRWAWSGTCSG